MAWSTITYWKITVVASPVNEYTTLAYEDPRNSLPVSVLCVVMQQSILLLTLLVGPHCVLPIDLLHWPIPVQFYEMNNAFHE